MASDSFGFLDGFWQFARRVVSRAPLTKISFIPQTPRPQNKNSLQLAKSDTQHQEKQPRISVEPRNVRADLMTLLVTSIPPSVKRLDRGGAEIGSQYQRQCVESWKRAGFSPLSIYSSRERVFPGLCQTAFVHRDASRLTGRPPSLLPIFSLSRANVRTVNRSGSLMATSSCERRLPNLSKTFSRGNFYIRAEPKFTIQSESTGESYRYGFDFFACHPSDAAKFKTSLVFGMPWWDHLLPLIAYKNRCRRVRSRCHQSYTWRITTDGTGNYGNFSENFFSAICTSVAAMLINKGLMA